MMQGLLPPAKLAEPLLGYLLLETYDIQLLRSME